MSLLGGLGKLLGREVQGIGNVYHGLNPFDKQGWTPPLPPTSINPALPVLPSQTAPVKSLPFQGSQGGIIQGNPNLNMPRLPEQSYIYTNGPNQNGAAFQVIRQNPIYDLLNGSFDYHNSINQALPLNSQYYHDEYPLQKLLPYIGGQGYR